MGEVLEVSPFYVETPLGVAEVKWLRTTDVVEITAQFGVFQCETKENWWWPNSEVRLCGSNSAKRDDCHSPIYLSDERVAFLMPHIRRHKKSELFWRLSKDGNG